MFDQLEAILTSLGHEFDRRQARLTEQREALSGVGSALDRLRRSLAAEPEEPRRPAKGPAPEAPSVADGAEIGSNGHAAPTPTGACAECGGPFTVPTGRGGKAKRFCGETCRVRYHGRRANERKAQRAAEAVVEPVGVEPAPAPSGNGLEKPTCAQCHAPFEPRDEHQRFCGPSCKAEFREQRRLERTGVEVPVTDPTDLSGTRQGNAGGVSDA